MFCLNYGFDSDIMSGSTKTNTSNCSTSTCNDWNKLRSNTQIYGTCTSNI